MNSKLKNQIYKFFIFSPLLLYFGKRSYIAYDEGFYALQARWIIESKNWIIPKWWDGYVLDRTIGIQFLIAKSQEIFGESSFSAHLPTTIASGLMLLITYKLHQELIGKKGAIFSALILATTYIWIDFAHLATQDMIFACLVNAGIYSLVKLNNSKKPIYNFLFGAWIGLAFMMKTFLIIIPLLSLIPFLYKKRDVFLSKIFWIGLCVGFLPFFIWALFINQFIDKNIIFLLFDKVNKLSSNNNFTNPFFYYFWNIPVNFLPWSIFAFIGLIFNFKKKESFKNLVFSYPIIFIILLSFFSTKTPYYGLPISSLLSLNAYIGIKEIIKSKKLKLFLINSLAIIIPILIFIVIAIYFISIRESSNFNTKEEFFLILGLFLLAISWLLINKLDNPKSLFIAIILGPYLLTSCIIQSGLLTDRSRDIRESMEYLISKENLNDVTIYVSKNDINSIQANSKIIRISLLTPNLGKGIKSLDDLKPSEFVWTTLSDPSYVNNNSLKIIYSDKNLNPWKLVKKKI
tara:strand:+ start:498 stop:2048 length:1551 start_codon:yes stop_codon:yes gene_type:complete